MKTRNVSKSPSAEGAQNVECLGTLVVRFHHQKRVVAACFGSELFLVDIVPTIGWKRHTIDDLVGLTARLGKLSCHATNFDHRHGASEGHDQSHLHNHTEIVTNMVHVEFFEALGAVPSHEDKSLALGNAGKLFVERSDLTGEDEWSHPVESLNSLFEFFLIFVRGHLFGDGVFPRRRTPSFFIESIHRPSIFGIDRLTHWR
mmetsp:Transcript_26736/g.54551  ORF Transcript_26736/g.54551 Transcript_26736/m.54551 type:complete len:202 (+) Transcript_26736:929-1534(+)